MIIINDLFYNLTHAIIKVKSFINTGKLLEITMEDVIENYKKGRKPEILLRQIGIVLGENVREQQ
jgi:hypothetical protein